jgi:O-antigen/teichoic acid export membrane protein
MTYGTNVGVAALSLVNVLVVARSLGPEGRGEVVFLTTVAVLTSALATLGVQQGIVNLASADPQLRRSLATNALVLAGVLGVIAMVCVGAVIAAFPAVGADSPTGLIWLSLASIPVVVLGTYLQLLIQAEYGFAFTNAVWLLPSVVNVAVNGLLAVLGVLTVASAVATWVAGQAAATALLAWYVARRSAGFGRPDLRLARRSLSFGVRSHVGSVMSLGNYRLDQWLLGSIAGTRELGLYSVAVAWSEALFFLPTALAAVQRPDLVRASPDEAGRSALAVFRAAILVTIPIGVVMILLAPVLCVTLFGEDFRGSIDDLRVLVPGAIGIVALKLMANAITSRDRPGLASIGIGIAFAATIVLDLILIPPYGGLGAAIASTAAYTIGGIAMALLAARVLGVGLGAFVPRRGDAVWLVEKGRGMLHAARSREA